MEIIPAAAIDAAAARIRGAAVRTPLLDVSRHAGGPLRLKCENLQVTGSFKFRGATSMIAGLGSGAAADGVITYSSGNHAQAVACAARARGIPAVVVMPRTAPAVKVDGARAYGAEVLFEGTTSVERRLRAEQEEERRGLTMVPPFDHPAIIAGQATVGREIMEDAPAAARVYVPVGGGGLLAGVASAVKQAHPAARVFGVEPVGAACMAASLAAGRPVTLESTASVADGLLPVRPGELTFEIVAALVDDVVTVTDDAIVGALAWLCRYAKLVVEPSGAAACAAALAAQPDGRRRGDGSGAERRQHRAAGTGGTAGSRGAYSGSAPMIVRAASIAAPVVVTSPSSCFS